MKVVKRYLFVLLSIIICLIVLSLFLSTLYYFDYISTDTYKVLKISIIVLTLIINSIVLGRSSIKNGYLDGIKLGFMLMLFCTLVAFSQKAISMKLVLYNIIILITTTLGSMIGINTKNKEKKE